MDITKDTKKHERHECNKQYAFVIFGILQMGVLVAKSGVTIICRKAKLDTRPGFGVDCQIRIPLYKK
jgi:hypothetical protein